MKSFRIGLLSIVAFFGVYSCSSTESAIKETATSSTNSIFPSWYQSNEFVSDSLGYSGFATAIASDSLKAIERAEIQARINLGKSIGAITEEIRNDMQDAGSTNVTNSDFIILLRTAHTGVETVATPNHSEAKKIGDSYRAFSSVQISKNKAKTSLEKGFSGHPRYWGELSSSAFFKKYF